ncbi:hypothetical protein RI129_001692 [Pyrocoelia pectoralis]|uniref:RNA helicase n=1 Tax=Pyrocoelia pectoralis TaxID=417401 RepID=A0AAN7ZXJ2_9COLE
MNMDRRNNCDICHCKDDLSNHKSSLQHRFNFALLEWNRYRRAIVKNRNGIEVNVKLHNIVMTPNDLIYNVNEKKGSHEIKLAEQRAVFEMQQNNSITYIFQVINKQRSKSIFLMGVMLLHPNINFKLEDYEGKMVKNAILQLEPNASYSFKVTFFLSHVIIGTYNMPVAIHLQTTEKHENFTISREMLINIIGASEFNREVAVTKKSPFTSVVWNETIKCWYEPNVKVLFQNTYIVPKNYAKIIKMGIREFCSITGEEIVSLQRVQHLINPNYVTKDNYQDFFHITLWTDETGAELMLQRYNMENVNMKVIHGNLLELEVPGLAEKRPSLIKGDVVKMRLHGEETGYKGIIKTVNNLTIWIQGVNREIIEFISDHPYTEIDVSFQLGRLPYERMHGGVDRCVASGMVDYLFPENILHKANVPSIHHLNEFFNWSISTNPEQRHAVENIVFRRYNNGPYIVFGPPVEGFSYVNSNSEYYFWLVYFFRYYNDIFKPNYLFIDEAAQAMEPEACVAIGLLSPGSHVILAGDPKQLGPICASTVAENLGLNVSLLERLMKMPIYTSNNVNFISTLKLNFRAHPEVLQIPNELFYDSQLQAVSRKALLDPIANVCVYDKFSQRKVKNVAPSSLEFCAVFAKEMRQGRSPSYFNTKEAEMVIKYVAALLTLAEIEVLQSEIGVVTPYTRQVYRIKELLSKRNYSDVEVGTTEAFQGSEKRIIIISTVRAQYDLLLYDRKYKLGFVANEKRFNVALTRAMSKLIIIGCPNVLQYDKNWLKFIEYCEREQSYFGSRRDVRHDKLKQDVLKRLNNVYLKDQQHKHIK